MVKAASSGNSAHWKSAPALASTPWPVRFDGKQSRVSTPRASTQFQSNGKPVVTAAHGFRHLPLNMGKKEDAIAKLQTQAYEALSRYLEAHRKQIVEIEVLPSAIQPPDGLLMKDGLHLGIPKKTLALAFVEAQKIFFANVENQDSHLIALQATTVMLLFEPEHLSAANFRKRKLVELKSGTTPEVQLIYRKALKYEFCFLDSILTSPLHRQSKSPTLWHHRLWLLKLFLPGRLEDVPEDVRASFWRAELSSVCKSGEQHPKNYYAWQYARRLAERIDGTDATVDFAERVKAWCCKHPSDTSGWQCLLYIIPKAEPPSERATLVRGVIEYTRKLKLDNESIWVFLRTIIAHKSLQLDRTELCSALQEYSNELEGTDESAAPLKRVNEALAWIKKHGAFHIALNESS
jgi:hypothetical protein